MEHVRYGGIRGLLTDEQIDRGDVDIDGDDGPLRRLWDAMTDFEMFFAVIEP